jgi:hypothetical protein
MKTSAYLTLLSLAAAAHLATTAAAADSFRPGQPWLDDKGVHINAHGGGIMHHAGVYYCSPQTPPEIKTPIS